MKKIAVVEDEIYMREELCSMLKKAGYEALEVTVFEDAVKHLTVLMPDLWILISPELADFKFVRI